MATALPTILKVGIQIVPCLQPVAGMKAHLRSVIYRFRKFEASVTLLLYSTHEKKHKRLYYR